MFLPFVFGEVHEIIPYEKGKETMRAMLKAQIAAMRKQNPHLEATSFLFLTTDRFTISF
jgi:hypothetical protein